MDKMIVNGMKEALAVTLHRRQLDPKEYQREQRAEWENTVAATRTRLRLSQHVCGTARHFRQDAAQLGTGTAQADGRGAGAVARGVAASRSGFGRGDGVKQSLWKHL